MTARPITVEAIAASVPVDCVQSVRGDAAAIDLTHDSRQIRPGWAFACVVGATADGHDFAPDAVAAGATILLVERPLDLDVAQIVVTDVRRAMGHAAAAVHGHPTRSLTMVGVTGTNGKTTVSQMLGSIFRADGRTVEVIGTLTGSLTTPEAPDLQRRLAGFVADGVEAVVMEVSSHALVFDRVAGTRFDVSIFTNLGRDHRDLHESMEAYFRAKASLFEPELSVRGVTNVDDPYGQLLRDAGQIPMVGFSQRDVADVVVEVSGHRFTWRDQHVEVPFGGHFNVMNSLASLVAADLLGITPDVAAAGLAACPTVPGRFETVSDPERDRASVVVDYAHTPDGLEEVLRSARMTAGTGRVIAVFGCAGDRDVEKRPQMGAVGASLADVAIITSDNPRSEDPQAIVEAVAAGVDAQDRHKVRLEVDRREAIARAIDVAEHGDIVVIAGKGHESTQTIGEQTIPFDDRVEARRLLREAAADMSGEPS